jgi:O-antigen ligase
MMPAMSKRAICLTALIMGCSLYVDGATTHFSAAVLRALFAYLCICAWPQRKVPLQSLAIIPVGTALIAMLWGLTVADNPGLGIQATVTGTIICGLFLALTHSEQNTSSTLLKTICFVAVIHAAYALTLWTAEPLTRASGAFSNPNNLAAWLAPCALILLYFFVQQPSSKLPLVGTVICAAAVFASQSRSAVLALLIGAACFVAVSDRFKKYLSTLVVIATCGAAALLYNRFTGSADPLSFSRLSIWQSSLEVAFAHPEGVGIAGFAQAMRMHGIALDGLVHYPRFAQQAHNAILHGWIEAGFLGLVAIAAALATPFLALLRIETSWSQRLPHVGILLAFLIPAMFSTTFHVVIVIATAAVWTAYIFRLSHEPGPFEEEQSWAHVHASIGALGIVLIGFLVPGILNRHYQDEAQLLSRANNLPRAESVAQQAVDAAPFSVGAQLLLESLKFRQGEGPLVITERLLELGDRYPRDHRPVERATSLLAHAANQTKDKDVWAKAAAVGMAGLERNPHDCLTRVPLARAVYRSGQPQRAIGFLRETLEIEPNCASAHANLALMLRITGQNNDARVHAERAIAADRLSQSHVAREKKILSLAPATKGRMETLLNGEP